MNKNNHTPGPWMYTDTGLVGDQSGEPVHAVIAEVHDGNSYDHQDTDIEKRTANARLIASAPDLLETLKKILVSPDYMIGEIARAAIAKAEGDQSIFMEK